MAKTRGTVGKRKQTRRQVERGLKGPVRKRGPRSQPLPGLEQVRSRALDNICEGLGEERDRMNAAKKEEAGLITAALQRMQREGITVYKHDGIELARVPGAEKLRVRVVKGEGDAGAEDLEPPEEVAVERSEGEEAGD